MAGDRAIELINSRFCRRKRNGHFFAAAGVHVHRRFLVSMAACLRRFTPALVDVARFPFVLMFGFLFVCVLGFPFVCVLRFLFVCVLRFPFILVRRLLSKGDHFFPGHG